MLKLFLCNIIFYQTLMLFKVYVPFLRSPLKHHLFSRNINLGKKYFCQEIPVSTFITLNLVII